MDKTLEEVIRSMELPTACKDSGLPEWTIGESEKLANRIRQWIKERLPKSKDGVPCVYTATEILQSLGDVNK